MKSNNQNTPNPDNLTQSQINELENDNIWSLLDKADKTAPVEASPMFARNVMREIRLQHHNATPSLWQRITTPKFNKIALTLGATAACVLIATNFISQNNNPSSIAKTTLDTEFIHDIPLVELAAYSDQIITETPSKDTDVFAIEMLELADQDPFFITEEEIALAMNF